MSNERETIQHKGYEIETFYDEDAQSPNEWGNEDAFLVYDHRDFFVERKGFNPDDIFENLQSGKKLYKGYFVFPVFAYIHSGVALSLGKNEYPFNDRWDVSFKGFALIKKEKGQGTNKKAYEIAKGIVEEWNTYLSGQVYGYSSEFGGVWGFYGEEGYKDMIAQAKEEIDSVIEKKIKEHGQRVKAYIKNHVPIEKRQALAV